MRTLVCVACLSLPLMGSVAAAPVEIMSWNVENLFDTQDDATNPHDNTYLSLADKQAAGASHVALCEQLNPNPGFFRDQCLTLDWSAATYETKLGRIADVLLGLGGLPEVLVLPETENAQVIEDLVAKLGAGSYPTIGALDTSAEPDSRGIDVAIVSTLPLIGAAVAHKVDFKNDADICGATRDIVDANLELPDGSALTVLGVHFPSQGNPAECRIRAFQQVSDIRSGKGVEALVVVAGDLNFECSELSSPMYERLAFRGGWYLSPVVTAGCNSPGSSKFFDGLMSWNTWSFLDHILVSTGLSPTQASSLNWFADLGSFQTVVVHPQQILVDEQDRGFVEPRRFDPATGEGISDHWPVMIRLVNRRSATE